MYRKKLSYFFAVAEDVHFVDQEDDLLAPLADVLQKAHLAVRERPVCADLRQLLINQPFLGP